MFGRHYDTATAFQRVKYGCINLTGDIEGVRPARSYGAFFVSLKPSVRHRCTMHNMDTGGFRHGDTLATARNYSHVLEKYSEEELQSILALSRVGGGKSKCMCYKEIQIHGPVCLATDIESLSVPGRKSDASKQLLSMVDSFQKKAKCSILWQGDLLGYDNKSAMPGMGMMPPLAGLATGIPGFPPGLPGLGGGGGYPSASGSETIRAPFGGAGHRLGGK